MNGPGPLHFDAETMIGLDEFARRMNVCTNTVRYWIRSGKLVEGRHFVRQGRKYLFPWSPQLLALIFYDWRPVTPPKRPLLVSRRPNRQPLKLRC
uniref:DNA-binding protein n=1 Tax=Geobacter metallireducens TaxID=28232 RepID=A0A831U3R3_GEOME